MSAAAETGEGASREHPWDLRPRARVWALALPLGATVAASELIHLHNRLITEGRPLPVSGHILALLVAVGALWLALRLGLLTKEEAGLGREPRLVPFAIFFVVGAGLVSLGLTLYQYLGPVVLGTSLQEHLADANAYYGWCAFLTWDVYGPQPLAVVLVVVVEELLFRALWFPILWRVVGSYVWANLGQAVGFALWHGPFYVNFQPDKIIPGWIYGDIMVFKRTLAAPLGFHFGWNAAAALWMFSACP